eukprot:TRINITY_DN10331_c0_g1_i4.p1 TRINITY_DN10331_c0_g1~~TRINITY_DN10331_c0_g1_i4.p1  ORF type:complete len:1047 (+),score=144.51 TRINITY_DN10331_c0_g1_i4:74-3214(+)
MASSRVTSQLRSSGSPARSSSVGAVMPPRRPAVSTSTGFSFVPASSSNSVGAMSPAPALSRLHAHGLRREKAKDELLEFVVEKSARWRQQMLRKMGVAFKEMLLADPDLWAWLRRSFSAILDATWRDIESEIERGIQLAVTTQQVDANKKGPSSSVYLLNCWLRFRAKCLHHFLPHDKSTFGTLKDPAYLLIFALSCWPSYGIRVIVFSLLLLMLLFPNRPDEYQLVGFITLVKGTQFSTGFVALCLGALAYFRCYSTSKEQLLYCMDHSRPSTGSAWEGIIDYVGACILVWVAVLRLRWLSCEKREEDVESNSPPVHDKCVGRELLQALLRYDVKLFIVSTVLLLVVTVLTVKGGPEHDFVQLGMRKLMDHPQFKANVFWHVAFASIGTLPFGIFCVPGFVTILTHSHPTGYNEHGACVAFNYPSEAKPEEQEYVPPTDTIARWAPMLMGVVRTVQRGQQARSATDQSYKFGDFTRGVFSKAWSLAKRPVDHLSPSTQDHVAALGRNFLTPPHPDGSSGLTSLRDRLLPSSVSTEIRALRVRNEADKIVVNALEENSYILDIVSVRILEEITTRQGRVFYSIEITPTCSLDGSDSTTPWCILRRYSDFEALHKSLRGFTFEDAPFPGKRVFCHRSKQLVDERRRMLEVWLLCVIRQLQGDRNRLVEHVAAFLEAEPPPWAERSNAASRSVSSGIARFFTIDDDEDENTDDGDVHTDLEDQYAALDAPCPPISTQTMRLDDEERCQQSPRSSEGAGSGGLQAVHVLDGSGLVASVRITGRTQERGQSVRYHIESIPGALTWHDDLDLPWVVDRTYTDFRNLRQRIDPEFVKYEAAPFPGKEYLAWNSQEMLDRRQDALLAWLRNVAVDPETPFQALLDFLRRPTLEESNKPEVPKENSGPLEFLKRFGLSSNTSSCIDSTENTARTGWDVRCCTTGNVASRASLACGLRRSPVSDDVSICSEDGLQITHADGNHEVAAPSPPETNVRPPQPPSTSFAPLGHAEASASSSHSHFTATAADSAAVAVTAPAAVTSTAASSAFAASSLG